MSKYEYTGVRSRSDSYIIPYFNQQLTGSVGDEVGLEVGGAVGGEDG